MTLTVLAFNEHQVIKLVHTVISMTFLIVATWLFYRSVGWFF